MALIKPLAKFDFTMKFGKLDTNLGNQFLARSLISK